MSELEASLLFQVKAARLPTPVTQHRFAPPRRWRFDLSWPDRMLAVEVEGGTFIAGRHSRGPAMEKDMEKFNTAVLLGWSVLRVNNHHVEDGRALAWIEQALEAAA